MKQGFSAWSWRGIFEVVAFKEFQVAFYEVNEANFLVFKLSIDEGISIAKEFATELLRESIVFID